MTEFTFTPHGSKYDQDKPFEMHKDESVAVYLKDASAALIDFTLHYQTCFGQVNLRQDLLDKVNGIADPVAKAGTKMTAADFNLAEMFGTLDTVSHIGNFEAQINKNIASFSKDLCLVSDGVELKKIRFPDHLEVRMPDK
jgi:hypothetical protein